MKILDTTTINHILKNNLILEDTYFITPCIEDEMLTSEMVWGKKAPSNIKNISNEEFFDESLYLKNYFYILNKYGGRSFFNMTGFGDVSIISLVKTLVESIKNTPQNQLPLPEFKEEIIVYTSDDGLSKKIISEVGNDVRLLLSNEI
jgi:hypothetical protein